LILNIILFYCRNIFRLKNNITSLFELAIFSIVNTV